MAKSIRSSRRRNIAIYRKSHGHCIREPKETNQIRKTSILLTIAHTTIDTLGPQHQHSRAPYVLPPISRRELKIANIQGGPHLNNRSSTECSPVLFCNKLVGRRHWSIWMDAFMSNYETRIR